MDLRGSAIPARAVGAGEALGAGLVVETTAAVGGTYTIDLLESANSDLSLPTVLISRSIPAADLTAGTRHWLGVKRGASQRYVGLRYVLAGTTPAVTLTATLGPQRDWEVTDPTHSNAYSV